MIVTIPKIAQHAGNPDNLVTLEISDSCPKCGERRGGERWRGLSFDGSRRLTVDCWRNGCGHIDKYVDVVLEGKPVDNEQGGKKGPAYRVGSEPTGHWCVMDVHTGRQIAQCVSGADAANICVALNEREKRRESDAKD